MLQRMIFLGALLAVSQSFCVFESMNHEELNNLNPAEKLIYRYVTTETRPEEFAQEYMKLMRPRYGLYPEDADINITWGTGQEQFTIDFNTPTENGYPVTQGVAATSTMVSHEPRLRLHTCLGMAQDVEHALARAKHIVSLKRKYKMHPRISREYNETGRQQLYNALQRYGKETLAKHHFRYPNELPSNISLNEQRDIDADLMFCRTSWIPGLLAYNAGISRDRVQSLAPGAIFQQYAPRIDQQYRAARKAYEQHPERETLCIHL